MATDDALRAAILAAHARWSGEAGERFPVISDWEPQTAGLGTTKAVECHGLKGSVPRVPRVPSEKQYTSHVSGSPETNAQADAWAAWMERAAIREHDGRMSRTQAETLTALELGPCPPGHDRDQAIFASNTHSQNEPADVEGVASTGPT